MTNERRIEPRIVDDAISLKLKEDEFDTITHTLNISASGVYCKLDRGIPLMSRVKLMLVVPNRSGGEASKQIEVSGVVVREHPVIIDGQVKHHDIAIFFDGLTERDKEAISQYVKNRLN